MRVVVCSVVVVVVVVGAGCAPEPSPYLGPAPETTAPALDSAGVGVVVDGALPLLIQSPQRLLDLYLALTGPDGVVCADEHERDAADDGSLNEAWITDGCDDGAGVAFAGEANVSVGIGVAREDDEGVVEDNFSIEGDHFTVAAEDGRFLDVRGFLFVSRSANDASLSVSGAFTADDGQADMPALYSGGLHGEVDANAFVDGDARSLEVNAHVAGSALGDGTALDASVVVASDPCGNEPSGVTSVRDGAGVWHDVVFVDDDDAAGRCDGCGARSIAGAAAGDDVCVDAAGLLGWTGAQPW